MPKKSSKVNNSGDAPKWEYQCIYCNQTFFSGRALGGHQNAHRFEPREKRRTHHLRVPMRYQSLDGSSGPAAAVHSPPSPPNWSGGYGNFPMTGGLWPAAPLGHGNGFPAPPPLAAHVDHMQHAINVAPDYPWNGVVGRVGINRDLNAVEVTSKMRVDMEVDLELKL
ncbi:uncharacterized protein LOC132289158 [Cornus florida]|uniref:uncharacterized protein LOC132289158 n=1 Tax=Cornus florida TaxID=4283 RepID=UPI0028991870|nr:uncharacterized protein LOC132289158 [Cornus florida]